MDIQNNLKNTLNKINSAVKKSGRAPGSVKLMAVSKFHTVEEIKQTIDAGQILFGENRVQEVCEKFDELFAYKNDIQLHIIGSLQTNKVKNAVKYANCIQSVDRIDLLKEIEKQCAKINKTIDVLFELHTGEESKAGFESKEEMFKAMDLIANGEFPHINLKGFMTMAPFTDDKELIRKSFKELKAVAEEAKIKYSNFDLSELSMGMSNDFEIAIEEGSTMVRVGTAIFGERDYSK